MTWPAAGARVAVVGSANVDLVVRVPAIPRAGETVLGGDLHRFAGGKGANQAVAAARLGGVVTFVARVGDDELGRTSLEGYEGEGIDTRHVVVDPDAPTGAALIAVDREGENAIAVAPGANARLAPADVEAAADAIRGAGVLLLQLETPLEASRRAIAIAEDGGTAVILNPAPARPLERDLLGGVDVLTPNLEEARTLAARLGTDGSEPGELAAALLDAGVGRVAITLGGEGVLIADRDGSERLPARPVDAVDTTAAGDAFNGALGVAIAAGLGWRDAVAFGQRAGALAVTREGAQPSLPTLDEMRATA